MRERTRSLTCSCGAGVPQAVKMVAIDGVPVSGDSHESSILLPPGARAEFVVETPEAGEQAQLVTTKWDTGPQGDRDPCRPLANIVDSAGGQRRRRTGGGIRCDQGLAAASRWDGDCATPAVLLPAHSESERGRYLSLLLRHGVPDRRRRRIAWASRRTSWCTRAMWKTGRWRTAPGGSRLPHSPDPFSRA